MHRLQEVVRLHRMGRSLRVIARQLQMGRNTIKSYLMVLARGELLDGAPDELPELELLRACVGEHIPSKAAPQQSSSVDDRWLEKIHELRKQGAGPTAIHDHLRVNEIEYKGSLSAMKRLCLRLDRAAGQRAAGMGASSSIPCSTAQQSARRSTRRVRW